VEERSGASRENGDSGRRVNIADEVSNQNPRVMAGVVVDAILRRELNSE